jgi:hypothetical protein
MSEYAELFAEERVEIDVLPELTVYTGLKADAIALLQRSVVCRDDELRAVMHTDLKLS